MSQANNRAFYRIPYPEADRPRLRLGAQICEVLDCSERGLRFRLSAPPLPQPGTRLRGELRLPRGVTLPVEGVVVRVRGDEVAVHLTEDAVPYHVILREQLHLRRRDRLRTEGGSPP